MASSVPTLAELPKLREQLKQIALASKQSLQEIETEAENALAQMGSRHNRLAVWAFARLSRFMYRRGFNPDIYFDRPELARTSDLASRKSVVYLVSHKTYLDFFVLYGFLYRNGVAPPFIFGGINIAFSGFSQLARRAGGIFIRRSFRNDLVYKAVLQHYIAFLIANGHSFMWAIEGTRSRTGKLVLPKLGLLKYVVDASRSLGENAVSYVPVSVAYDQIPDAIEMSAQEMGAKKSRESVGWFIKYIRKTTGRFGDIYLRFAEPVSLHETPDAPDLDDTLVPLDEQSIAISKLAFEICYRINEVTPATETSLVLISLFCRGSATAARVCEDVVEMKNYIKDRVSDSLFTEPNRPLSTDVGRTMESLVENGVVERNNESPQALYIIAATRHRVALYYSNMAAHHFAITAFTEVALHSVCVNPDMPAAECFKSTVLQLRDLFKFEFFFAPKHQFMEQFEQELRFRHSSLEEIGSGGIAVAETILKRSPLLLANGLLRPYVAAYQAVVWLMLQNPGDRELDDASFVAKCQNQSRLNCAHIAPKTLLMNGYRLARNRDLFNSSKDEERQAMADELDDLALQLVAISRLQN